MNGWDMPHPGAQDRCEGGREGAEALSHLQSLADSRLPSWAQGALRASLRGISPPAGANTCQASLTAPTSEMGQVRVA